MLIAEFILLGLGRQCRARINPIHLYQKIICGPHIEKLIAKEAWNGVSDNTNLQVLHMNKAAFT